MVAVLSPHFVTTQAHSILEAFMMVRSFGRNAAMLATVLLLPLATACGSDKSTGPDMGDVAGSYDATTLTATQDGTSHDFLADGASIHLVLEEDGTASGHLSVPASDLTEGEAVDEEMTGSWTLEGGTVNLTQSADTFIRDLPLVVDGNTLTGDATYGNVQVHLIMSRQ